MPAPQRDTKTKGALQIYQRHGSGSQVSLTHESPPRKGIQLREEKKKLLRHRRRNTPILGMCVS